MSAMPAEQSACPPGLHVFSSNSPEILADHLAEILSGPCDPLAPETVLVQSVGLSRWLSLELAKRTGVCANVRFVFPNAFLNGLFRAVIPGFTQADEGLFAPDSLCLRIMKHLPLNLGHPAFRLPARYLEDDEDGKKLVALSGVIARTFDRYMLFRPEMVLNWDRGLGSHWQAVLWRGMNGGLPAASRPALLERFRKSLGEPGADVSTLPRRICLFGVSGLPPFHFSVFSTLAGIIPVHLLHANPCREYWADIVSEKRMRRLLRKTPERLPEDLHLYQGNSLLAGMGKPGADFLALVQENTLWEEAFSEPSGDTVLAAIQRDILNLNEPCEDGDPPRSVATGDRSIEVHSTHGAMREIEVVKDILFDLFERDPKLSPHEILVAAPDINKYAPFIDAVFGVEDNDAARIPHCVAGRASSGENQAQKALCAVLETARGRFEAADVLDLLAMPSVAARFGIAEDGIESSIESFSRWVVESRIFWGIDAAHKARLNLPPEAANTWKFGLDRLFLGFAMSPSEHGAKEASEEVAKGDEGTGLYSGIAPLDIVEGSEAQLLGVFADFLSSLFSLSESLSGKRTLPGWAALFGEAINGFIKVGQDGVSGLLSLRRSIGEMAENALKFGVDGLFGLDAAIGFLGESLASPPGAAGFLRHGVNFVSLAAARGIPFKVTILCGMNEGEFPRSDQYPGFDFMGLYPKPGDRSGRDDDRYLFLETLLCAREKLVISYTGRSRKDNSEIEPSPLVNELLDYIDANFTTGEKGKAHSTIRIEHRLHGFSADYFSGGVHRLFSYDPHHESAAKSAEGARVQAAAFAPEPLPPPPDSFFDLDLETLARFFNGPQKFFLRQRLRFDPDEISEDICTSEPFSVEGLEKTRLFSRMLDGALKGRSPETWRTTALALGILPHGTGGLLEFDSAARVIVPFCEKVKVRIKGAREPVFADLRIGGFRLRGHISGLFEEGMVRYRAAKLTPKDILKSWIFHLALSMLPEGEGLSTFTLSTDGVFSLPPIGNKEAEENFSVLLDIYKTGLSSPALFFPRTSHAFARTLFDKNDGDAAMRAAASAFQGVKIGKTNIPGEREEAAVALCFRNADPLKDPLLEVFRETAKAVFTPVFFLWDKEP